MGKKLKVLKTLGLTILGGTALVACGTNQNQNTYNGLYNDMPLISEGVHMKEGKHNFVITDQFYELLTYDSFPHKQETVINGLKEAYSNLDKYTSSLDINLCTTVDKLANEYNIQKVDSIGEQDVALYLSENADTKATYSYNTESKEMKDLSVTFNKDYVSAFWKSYNTMEEIFSPYNTAIYTYAVRTGMETMGIRYFNENQSVMNDLTDDSPKDITNYDIELLDKYCVNFYNAESTLKNTENHANTVATYNTNDDEFEM